MTKALTTFGPLPVYRVVESRRARHLRLRMSLQDGLEVIVPRGYDHRQIPRLVQQKESWIRRAVEKIEQHRYLAEQATTWRLPTEITLLAIGQTWHVQYYAQPKIGVSAREVGGWLCLYGATQDRDLCAQVLKKWLMGKAREFLIPGLKTVSNEMGLPFTRITIRCQRGRWGSCSRDHAISLNARLLFLEPKLVRYIFIHELCHTVHPNHSARYWQFVRSKEPDCKALDRALKTAGQHIPPWAAR